MCFPAWETHICCDMCSPTQKTHVPSDMWEYVCSPTGETYSLSDMCSITQETHVTGQCHKALIYFFLGRGTHVRSDKNLNLSSSTSPLTFYNVPSSGMHVLYTFCIVTLLHFYRTFYRNTPVEGVVREKKNRVWLD